MPVSMRADLPSKVTLNKLFKIEVEGTIFGNDKVVGTGVKSKHYPCEVSEREELVVNGAHFEQKINLRLLGTRHAGPDHDYLHITAYLDGDAIADRVTYRVDVAP